MSLSRGTPRRARRGGISALLPAAFAFAGLVAVLPRPGAAAEPEPPFPFADGTQAAGLDFVHFSGMTGKRYFIEMMGSGGAFFDYDRDGDLDLFAVQGTLLDPAPSASLVFPPPAAPGSRLFRNQLREKGELRFEDVTAASGISTHLYGMGAAVGDFDSDGFEDLFVSGYGQAELWRNRGDGRFENVTAPSGLENRGGRRPWSMPAVFFDADGDGDEDLYVGEYVEYSVADDKPCFSAGGAADYCGPIAYKYAQDHLYRNRGDGRFEEISAVLGAEARPALGAVSLDVDGDGRLELYVANDGVANFLWRRRGDGTFENLADLSGCAVNAAGLGEASMGVDAADADGDGDEDLFMTHLSQETNTFYRNQGELFFDDDTAPSGLGPPSFPMTSFGTRFLDFDLDGDLDLVTVSGTIRTIEAQVLAKEPHPLRQRAQLFRNGGDGHFSEIAPTSSPLLERTFVGRGLAVGDVDNDGDADLAIFSNAGPLQLWLGQAATATNFVGFEVVGKNGGPAVGARIGLVLAGGKKVWQRVRRDGSYLSSHDPRLLFGLAATAKPVEVLVAWPGGGLEAFPAPAPGQYHRLVPGQGSAR